MTSTEEFMGLKMGPYRQWAQSNKRKAPPNELLMPLLDAYESNKPAASIGDFARAIGESVSYTRVQSWIERARIRNAEPPANLSRWATLNEDEPKSQHKTKQQWENVLRKAERGRLVHLAQVKRIEELRPLWGTFHISMELRERGLWPYGGPEELTAAGVL